MQLCGEESWGTSPTGVMRVGAGISLANDTEVLGPLRQSTPGWATRPRHPWKVPPSLSCNSSLGCPLRAKTTAAAAEAKQACYATPAPVASLGLEDAFRKQLGLRLNKQR